MTRVNILMAAGAAGLAFAASAAAQTPYQSPYAYPQQGYPQPGYPQGQYYPPQAQGGVSQVINQLLGNRYQANDRYAVERCATAAMAQASTRYGSRYPQGYGYQNQGYGYGNQGHASMRVTAITEVRRRNNGVRVSGLLDSRAGAYPPYGNAYGYQGQGNHNPRYAGQGDLTFRCNVDYRGAVSNIRINRNRSAYNRGI